MTQNTAQTNISLFFFLRTHTRTHGIFLLTRLSGFVISTWRCTSQASGHCDRLITKCIAITVCFFVMFRGVTPYSYWHSLECSSSLSCLPLFGYISNTLKLFGYFGASSCSRSEMLMRWLWESLIMSL